MTRKILAVLLVFTLVACNNAEKYSETDVEDSPMIQERRCEPSGKPCRPLMRIPCCGSCVRGKCA
uniref:U6-theraphotoxin-Cg1a n=1 Tax=Chilobrachys guangxiensis TaxID=278060 RepID=JZT51_CHIGU|nr:RecName: Full=U6-theraphotoxin-Cg1a; Short=U6-TRTX-Cg1a; AltName: Full=Jingzhaotoxin F7-8.06; AltName: Full=Jingzhaotoxin-51; Short=JZTX-51; AltName: Full=Peptide F7-8.06; Flags: Precursor [Chilobrachys guangxiensis]ABY71664.1 cystine knot toxin [Chilobrachys guangxiensis]